MRADGKRLRNTDPMYTVASYVMSKRVDTAGRVDRFMNRYGKLKK